MIFHAVLYLAMVTAAVSVVSFLLYARARMQENEKLELRCRSIHYFSLLLFVTLGVILLVMLSNMNL